MPEITIAPATADRFDDAERALSGGGDGRSCQCQWWMLTSARFTATTRPEREDLLRSELGTTPAPALIAYVDGDPAGWVRVGPRVSQPRLGRTRAIAAHSREGIDDPSVWAVSCFAVRREHRGLGLNARLLDAAVAHAREHGARVIEAYPIDTGDARTSPNPLFRGVLSVFARAGFVEVARTAADRTVVALDLTVAPNR